MIFHLNIFLDLENMSTPKRMNCKYIQYVMTWLLLVTKLKHCRPKGKHSMENYVIVHVIMCIHVKFTKSFLHKLVTSYVIIVWEKLNIIQYVSWCWGNEKNLFRFIFQTRSEGIVSFQRSSEISSHPVFHNIKL